MQIGQSNRYRPNVPSNLDHVEDDLLNYKVGDSEFLNNLITNQRFMDTHYHMETDIVEKWDAFISISFDTLIEILGPNMEEHDFNKSLSEL